MSIRLAPIIIRRAHAILVLTAAITTFELVPHATAVPENPTRAVVRALVRDAAFALLANGRLIQIDLATARIVRSRPLTAGLARIVLGRSLALSRDRSRLYVLISRWSQGPQEIIALNAVTLAVRGRLALPEDLVVRSIAVGPQSGNVYVFANTGVTDAGSAASLIVLRPLDGALTTRHEFRRADGRDWYVFDAALDRDERRAYVSYHGGCFPGRPPACTTGADVLTLDSTPFSRCSSDDARNAGCLAQAHGQIAAYGAGALAASGGPLIQFGEDGQEVRRLPTRLPRSHTMTFALTANARAAVSINPCPSSHVSVIALGSGQATVRARGICGTKIAPAKSGRILVGKTLRAVPQYIQGELLIHDPKKKRIRRIPTPSEALDVLTP